MKTTKTSANMLVHSNAWQKHEERLAKVQVYIDWLAALNVHTINTAFHCRNIHHIMITNFGCIVPGSCVTYGNS